MFTLTTIKLLKPITVWTLQLSRLEDNVDVAAPKSKQKSMKNVHMSEGKVLKTISKEKQHLGKVTRFQLYDGDLPKKNYGNLKGKKMRNDWSKILEISSIPKDYSRLDEGRFVNIIKCVQ